MLPYCFIISRMRRMPRLCHCLRVLFSEMTKLKMMEKKVENLIRGILAGNIFDLGSAQVCWVSFWASLIVEPPLLVFCYCCYVEALATLRRISYVESTKPSWYFFLSSPLKIVTFILLNKCSFFCIPRNCYMHGLLITLFFLYFEACRSFCKRWHVVLGKLPKSCISTLGYWWPWCF
jgi:hypothetical protein